MDAVTLALAKAYTNSQRLGYVETVLDELAPETVMRFEGGAPVMLDGVTIEEGKIYVVKWNGVEYTCKPFVVDLGGQVMVTIGNGKTYGFADTGEPFMIMYSGGMTAAGSIEAMETGGVIEVSVGISTKAEIIHTIDPKFLPEGIGGGLPTVEFTTAFDTTNGEGGEGVELTAEESAFLNEQYANNTPIVVKGSINGAFPTSGVFAAGTTTMTQGASYDSFISGFMVTLFRIPGADGWVSLMRNLLG